MKRFVKLSPQLRSFSLSFCVSFQGLTIIPMDAHEYSYAAFTSLATL